VLAAAASTVKDVGKYIMQIKHGTNENETSGKKGRQAVNSEGPAGWTTARFRSYSSLYNSSSEAKLSQNSSTMRIDRLDRVPYRQTLMEPRAKHG
jgi:hypothetical protein